MGLCGTIYAVLYQGADIAAHCDYLFQLRLFKFSYSLIYRVRVVQ